MGKSKDPDFRENDIHLLQTGDFADGTIKCQGRTWKVHRALLASRLKFFKAAFYGSFSEAMSGEIDFPESDPDSVDMMLRHLYGEVLIVEDLKTPALCVRCWKLADYIQLDTFKCAAISSLEDHLHAMVFLASNDIDMERLDLKWLRHFFDGLEKAAVDRVTESLQTMFVGFLWVTRYEILKLSETWDVLEKCPGVSKELLKVLVWNDFDKRPPWIFEIDHSSIECEIRDKVDYEFRYKGQCARCGKGTSSDPTFYNPFPVGAERIGALKWCQQCVERFNRERDWPWRSTDWSKRDKVKVDAWSWLDEE